MIELLAVIFSIIYVVLAAKQNVWCWAAAIISTTLYIYVCFTAQIYAETGLQCFYLVMAFYGYYNWNKKDQTLEITQWSVKTHLLILTLGAVLIFLTGFFLSTYTSAQMPIIDSFTTIFSLFATYMVIKKVLENWLYWIVIDIISVFLYDSRDLHLSAVLFIIYTGIAVFGYFNWIKVMESNE